MEGRDIGYNVEKIDPFDLDNCVDKKINAVELNDWLASDTYFHTIVYYTVVILPFFVIKAKTIFI